MKLRRQVAATATIVVASLATAHAAPACEGPKTQREASLSEIAAFVQEQQRQVLTFTGYSGAGYERPDAMLERAAAILAGEQPAATLVNIGATAEGIGAVYEVAKRQGFTTIGIVSTQARDQQVPLSKCVDHVFFVKDATWGGRLADGAALSPTSAAIVGVSTAFVGIGGGDVTRDELLAARQAGKPVTFVAADMNHALAIEKAKKAGRPAPTQFQGSAHDALAGGGR